MSASSLTLPALLRLASSVLVETHDEWQVSGRRYLSEGSTALLDKTNSQTKGGRTSTTHGMNQIHSLTRPWEISYTTDGTPPAAA